MSKNIVFIGHAQHLAEKLHWARSARDRGNRVHLLGYDEHDAKYQDQITHDGFEFTSVGSRQEYDEGIHTQNTTKDVLSYYRQKLTRALKELNPDLVHIIDIVHMFTATVVADALRIPSVTSTTGLYFVADLVSGLNTHSHLYPALQQSCQLAKGVITFQNPDDIRLFAAANLLHAEQRILVPSSGIDTTLFSYADEPINSHFTVTQIGRICEQKGVDTFINAANILSSESSKYRFNLVGGISHTDYCPDQLRSLPNVTWYDYTDNVVRHIHHANVICLASKEREGAPRSLLEASSCGRAIIATEVPGCVDIVQPGVNGLLVPPGSPSCLAEAIRFLHNNRKLRVQMGLQGRNFVEEKYSTKVITAQFEECYNAVLGKANIADTRASTK